MTALVSIVAAAESAAGVAEDLGHHRAGEALQQLRSATSMADDLGYQRAGGEEESEGDEEDHA